MRLTKDNFLKKATITKEVEKSTKESILKIEIYDDLFYICEDGIFCSPPAYLKLTYLKYKSLAKFAK